MRLNQKWKGFRAVDLMDLFRTHRQYKDYNLTEVKVSAKATCGYRSITLMVNEKKIDLVEAKEKTGWLTLNTNGGPVYFNENTKHLKLYFSGCFELAAIQIKFR